MPGPYYSAYRLLMCVIRSARHPASPYHIFRGFDRIGSVEITREPSSVLAETWSDVFRVDPPKKFDGVPGMSEDRLFYRSIYSPCRHQTRELCDCGQLA